MPRRSHRRSNRRRERRTPRGRRTRRVSEPVSTPDDDAWSVPSGITLTDSLSDRAVAGHAESPAEKPVEKPVETRAEDRPYPFCGIIDKREHDHIQTALDAIAELMNDPYYSSLLSTRDIPGCDDAKLKLHDLFDVFDEVHDALGRVLDEIHDVSVRFRLRWDASICEYLRQLVERCASRKWVDDNRFAWNTYERLDEWKHADHAADMMDTVVRVLVSKRAHEQLVWIEASSSAKESDAEWLDDLERVAEGTDMPIDVLRKWICRSPSFAKKTYRLFEAWTLFESSGITHNDLCLAAVKCRKNTLKWLLRVSSASPLVWISDELPSAAMDVLYRDAKGTSTRRWLFKNREIFGLDKTEGFTSACLAGDFDAADTFFAEGAEVDISIMRTWITTPGFDAGDASMYLLKKLGITPSDSALRATFTDLFLDCARADQLVTMRVIWHHAPIDKSTKLTQRAFDLAADQSEVQRRRARTRPVPDMHDHGEVMAWLADLGLDCDSDHVLRRFCDLLNPGDWEGWLERRGMVLPSAYRGDSEEDVSDTGLSDVSDTEGVSDVEPACRHCYDADNLLFGTACPYCCDDGVADADADDDVAGADADDDADEASNVDSTAGDDFSEGDPWNEGCWDYHDNGFSDDDYDGGWSD